MTAVPKALHGVPRLLRDGNGVYSEHDIVPLLAQLEAERVDLINDREQLQSLYQQAQASLRKIEVERDRLRASVGELEAAHQLDLTAAIEDARRRIELRAENAALCEALNTLIAGWRKKADEWHGYPQGKTPTPHRLRECADALEEVLRVALKKEPRT